jgi:two-component system response regulator AtoC
MDFEWPGNVRQLENLIKRMVVLGSEAPIVHELEQPAVQFQHWPQAGASAPRPPNPPQYAPPQPAPSPVVPAASAPSNIDVERMAVAGAGGFSGRAATDNVSLKDISRTAARGAERELILRMLTRTRWNRKEAAEILGISYKALLYKIKENGLDKAS